MNRNHLGLIDTHTHVYLEQFDSDRTEVIQRAKDAGLSALLLPNIDDSSVDKLLSLCSQYPTYCFPMLGLHPCSVNENFNEQLEKIKKLSEGHVIYAVGEIGLDLYWRKDNLEDQLSALRRQFDWAIEANLPVAIHCREANKQLIEELKIYHKKGLRGVWHCFTGSQDEAELVIEMGYYLGIGGVLTYKNSNLKNFISELSYENLLFETDAPYLAPVPKRGKRNEPGYTLYIAEFLSHCTGKSLGFWSRQTTENAIRLFNLPQI